MLARLVALISRAHNVRLALRLPNGTFYFEDTKCASLYQPKGVRTKNPVIVDYAALLLRIALALMFFAHAWLKIKVFTPVGTAKYFDPDLPDWVRPGSLATIDALEQLRGAPQPDWRFLSPAAEMRPGTRTGKFRLGGVASWSTRTVRAVSRSRTSRWR